MAGAKTGSQPIKVLDTGNTSERFYLHRYPRAKNDVVAEVIEGLESMPKTIAPKFFYDSKGARLFDQITELAEYYPTRTERKIYTCYKEEIAHVIGQGKVLIEPGSGNSEKVRLLLEALLPSAYVPFEITESHLLEASLDLVNNYPWLEVHAVCADYSNGLDLPDTLPDNPRVIFFPGSTIGNFEPEQAVVFLRHLRRACGDTGGLLIGVDMEKDINTLEAAYNDRKNVTARFNLNALDHINKLTGSNFNTDKFRHYAFYNRRKGRIEMHLESLARQDIVMAGRKIELSEGERIHSENSYKYTTEGFANLVRQAGFEPVKTWSDEQRWFNVHYLSAA